MYGMPASTNANIKYADISFCYTPLSRLVPDQASSKGYGRLMASGTLDSHMMFTYSSPIHIYRIPMSYSFAFCHTKMHTRGTGRLTPSNTHINLQSTYAHTLSHQTLTNKTHAHVRSCIKHSPTKRMRMSNTHQQSACARTLPAEHPRWLCVQMASTHPWQPVCAWRAPPCLA